MSLPPAPNTHTHTHTHTHSKMDHPPTTHTPYTGRKRGIETDSVPFNNNCHFSVNLRQAHTHTHTHSTKSRDGGQQCGVGREIGGHRGRAAAEREREREREERDRVSRSLSLKRKSQES